MDAVQLLATAIGLIGLAGGVTGYFAKGRGDSIIKYQANEIELRDGTIARLKEEGIAKDEQLKSKDLQIEQIQGHNKYLQRMAQGSPQLVKLTKEIKRLADIVSQR